MKRRKKRVIMTKTIKKPEVKNINNIGKGMEVATECVVAKNMTEAFAIFSEMSDITFATVDTAYFEHASDGSVGARISFEGTDEEIWADDVDSVRTYVLVS
jgi:hypothetical protein